jgi:hypothetical protein
LFLFYKQVPEGKPIYLKCYLSGRRRKHGKEIVKEISGCTLFADLTFRTM